MNIALVGKWDGAGWRMENLVQRGLWALGHTVYGIAIPAISAYWPYWSVDEPAHALDAILEVDLTVVIQGHRLSAAAIDAVRQRTKAPVVLWHGEVLGDQWPTADTVVQAKVAALGDTLHAYDLVVHNCRTSLPLLHALGARQVAWLPVSAIDPGLHQPLGVPKAVDVGIYGWASERRYQLVQSVLDRLPGKTFSWPDPSTGGAYGDNLVHFINLCRVVLCTHFSETPNTETRLWEVLGCGVSVVSEPISMPELFLGLDALQVAADADGLAERILMLLDDEEQRERWAREAHEYVHACHTYEHRCRQLLEIINKEMA
jgi:glycosyltransferase involved in cell wall biosynthesis